MPNIAEVRDDAFDSLREGEDRKYPFPEYGTSSPELLAQLKTQSSPASAIIDLIDLLPKNLKIFSQRSEIISSIERIFDDYAPKGKELVWEQGTRFRVINSDDAQLIRENRNIRHDEFINTWNSLAENPKILKIKGKEISLMLSPSTLYLGVDICKHLYIQPLNVSYDRFADTALDCKINDNIKGRNIVLVHSLYAPVSDAKDELQLMLRNITECGAASVHVVLPHMAEARSDRFNEHFRSPVASKHLVDLMEASSKGIITDTTIVEVHNHATLSHFQRRADVVYVLSLLLKDIESYARGKDVVVFAPDLGAAKRNQYILNELRKLAGPNAKVSFNAATKTRSKDGRVEKIRVINRESIKDKTILIFDDIVDTGGSILAVSEAAKRYGAKEVIVVATHGLFSKNALIKLKDATLDLERKKVKIIDRVIVSDTVLLSPYIYRDDFVKVYKTGALLAEDVLRKAADGSTRGLSEAFLSGDLYLKRYWRDIGVDSLPL